MATIIVWAAMIYAATAGFVSVVPQVFWPEPSARAREAVPEDCPTGLLELHSELMTRAGDRVAHGGSDERSLRRWMSSWDDRHLALEPRCTTERQHELHAALDRLRHHLETSLHGFDREEGELARELERELRALASRSPEETH